MNVGGSVWGVEIDPKRLREEKKTTPKKEHGKTKKEHQTANIMFNIEVFDPPEVAR